MIQSAKFTRALDCADVRGFLDCADERGIAPRIATDGADFVFSEIEAVRARLHALGENDERVSEAPALFRRLLEKMVSKPKSGLSPDAGKLGQLRR